MDTSEASSTACRTAAPFRNSHGMLSPPTHTSCILSNNNNNSDNNERGRLSLPLCNYVAHRMPPPQTRVDRNTSPFIFTAGNMHSLFIQELQKCDWQIGNGTAFWHISINIIKTVKWRRTRSRSRRSTQKGSLTWHIPLFAFNHWGVCLDTTGGWLVG